jgi:hypothetical protein
MSPCHIHGSDILRVRAKGEVCEDGPADVIVLWDAATSETMILHG